MSTVQTYQTLSTGLENTLELAEQVGSKLHGGETIELVSDLGGGKTTFTRGLANGLGSFDSVHSPSFTISNVYEGSSLSLHHYDFYRLNDPGILSREIEEVLADQSTVVVVEWAGALGSILPRDRLTIKLRVTGDDMRELTFSYPSSLEYLIPFDT